MLCVGPLATRALCVHCARRVAASLNFSNRTVQPMFGCIAIAFTSLCYLCNVQCRGVHSNCTSMLLSLAFATKRSLYIVWAARAPPALRVVTSTILSNRDAQPMWLAAHDCL